MQVKDVCLHMNCLFLNLFIPTTCLNLCHNGKQIKNEMLDTTLNVCWALEDAACRNHGDSGC